LTLEDRLGRIVGLCAYDVRPDLHRNRVLVIENFAVVTLIGAPRAAAELLAAMEQLARDRACHCLAVSLLGRRVRRSPDRDRGRTGRFFKGAGFRLDLARLCKCFDPAPAETFETAGAIGRPSSPEPQP
jgi:hypothetical protein